MINARIKNLAIAIALTILLAFLYIKTTDINVEEHNRYVRGLRQLKEQQATLDKHLLESRYGQLTSYDLLNQDVGQLNQQQAELAQVPAFLSAAEAKEIKALLQEHKELLNQKAALLEQFKSQNAILNNSLRYFPIATSKLLDKTFIPPLTSTEKDSLTDLLADVLVYYLIADSQTQTHIQQQMETVLAAIKKDSPSAQDDLQLAFSHAQKIISLKPKIENIVKEMLFAPSHKCLERMIEQYDSYYEKTLRRINFYRFLLFAFSVLLLLYIGYIFVKLKQASLALQTANNTLDHKVQERTAKLHVINQELRQSEASKNALICAIPDSLLKINYNGSLLDFIPSNNSNLFGETKQWEGKTIHELLPPEVATTTMHHVRQALDKGQMQIFEFQFLHHERIHYYESRLVVCSDGEVLAIVRDISEQKFLEDQLQRSQKLESIGQLAAGIAHEINTPTQYVSDNTRFLKDSFQDLNAVLTKNGQLLQACRAHTLSPQLLHEVEQTVDQADVDYLTEEIPKAIEQALMGVERISKIVQSMKEFAHPGSNHKQATDLNRAIESTLTITHNQWKYVAELETDFDPDLPPVPCFTGEFNQVVLNLIVNATHAISDVIEAGRQSKGRLTLSTRRSGEWAEIRIGDNGTGIPEAVRGKIFDPFFTTKQVGKGTGQGLAISHNVIVEKHQGQLLFETEEGKGTTFIIRLPLFDPSLKNSLIATNTI